MRGNARRYPHPIRSRDPSDSRGAGDQSEEAAERCGLHRTYYSGIERGVRNVSLVNIEKIAKGLRNSLPELFSRVSK